MGRAVAPWKGFVEGGLASVVAGTVTHPLDLIKVRMQLQGEALLAQNRALVGANVTGGTFVGILSPHGSALAVPKPGPITVGWAVIQREGMSGLFNGVSATVLRQAVYSSTRMGIYESIKRALDGQAAGTQGGKKYTLPLYQKVIAALFSGAIGAAVGNPADIAMVRMQADGRLPEQLRRNYTNAGNAIVRIAKQEGIFALWRGCGPTVQRAMVVTASQLATYDQAKEALLRHRLMRDGFPAHITASFTAGFVASVTSSPLDVIKTRLMSMKVSPGGKAPYSGALDCAIKTVQAEGVMALYKGFIPTVTRQGPFTVVLFCTLEQIKKIMDPL